MRSPCSKYNEQSRRNRCHFSSSDIHSAGAVITIPFQLCPEEIWHKSLSNHWHGNCCSLYFVKFLSNVDNYDTFSNADRLNEKEGTVTFSWSHAFATVKFNTKEEQVLLIPLTLLSSMYRSFYMAAFTKACIRCAWSTSHIGLVTVFYGLSAAVSSLLSGYVVKFVGRKCVFVVCQAVSTINLVFMLLWKPRPRQSLLFYLAGSLWGMNAGVISTQLKGEEETASSCFSVHLAAGFAISFVYDEYLCTSVKLYILLVFSCVELIGYLLTEREYQREV
ncbi:protein unc-93 A [Caerostris extrusa]|uniref:Protein unc-93 A n=1 Tax=Caerostris extrusa TaxID=172846 RepID=A0AAV4XVD3_CAEEX|nr:protein unc-93 A [Caerostris extrusa]